MEGSGWSFSGTPLAGFASQAATFASSASAAIASVQPDALFPADGPKPPTAEFSIAEEPDAPQPPPPSRRKKAAPPAGGADLTAICAQQREALKAASERALLMQEEVNQTKLKALRKIKEQEATLKAQERELGRLRQATLALERDKATATLERGRAAAAAGVPCAASAASSAPPPPHTPACRAPLP